AVALVLEPAEPKQAPRSEYEAKFSLQYSTAAMLVHGRVGVRTYSEDEMGDPRVLALARKVRYEVKDYPSYPAAFPGGVRIRLRDGRVLEADAPYQLGGPENPMSAMEVRAKFRENAALALDDSALAAPGEVRAAFSMTEPHAGSDVQSIRTTATRDGDDYVVSGQKLWVTNGWRSGIVLLLAKTDAAADPPHTGMTGFVIEKEPEVSELPGLTIPMPG